MNNRKENERTKYVQEKCQTLLTQMLRDEDNKYCVDCDAKGPRWASWNIGIFLCIRCAGIHRNLGVHISRVKSVNLDTWTPEQVISLQQMGNSRARAVYEAQLPDGFRRPQTDSSLENFIRGKYEHKKYLAKEWVSTPNPKVDWNQEIDEEIDRQKRKKKTGTTISLAKPDKSSSQVKNCLVSTPTVIPPSSSDLLSLSSPTLVIEPNKSILSDDSDIFNNFLSATKICDELKEEPNFVESSLDKQEADFFNQSTQNEKTKAKLTKDSIMALYGNPLNSKSFNSPIISGFNNSSFVPHQSAQAPLNHQLGQFIPIPGHALQSQSNSFLLKQQNFSESNVYNMVNQEPFTPVQSFHVTQSKTDSPHQKQVNLENVWQ